MFFPVAILLFLAQSPVGPVAPGDPAQRIKALSPDSQRFVDLALQASTDSTRKTREATRNLAIELIRVDEEGHLVGPVAPRPQPRPRPKNAPPPVPPVSDIVDRLRQADPQTQRAISAFTTKLSSSPEHTTEAIRALYNEANPKLKSTLAPLISGKPGN